MKIIKIINNNIVQSINAQEKEVILMGKALGFKRKVGETIDDSQIEKIYVLNKKNDEKEILDLLANIDFSHIQVVNKIVDYAEKMTGRDLTSSIYISLLDHIHFAIERLHNNQMFKNQLHQEIKRFYPLEYKIGTIALEIIKDNLKIELPIDEASFIAMHILNSQLNENYVENTQTMTDIIQKTLEIAENTLNVKFDDNSINYDRLITHLKFFSYRLINGEILKSVDHKVFKVIKDQYSLAFKVSNKVKQYIKMNYDKEINDAELMYLTIHLNTFINRNMEKSDAYE